MMESALEALTIVFAPERLVFIAAGVAIGILVGIIPGMGGVVGMSILLPFTFGMEPFTGIAFLIGFTAVVHTADTFPSVLLGIPGSSGAQATIMDGYPMSRRGDGAHALGAGFMASLLGGLFGAVFLLVAILAARPLVLNMNSAHLFMLALLGLSMVGVLAKGGKSPFAGIIGGLFGLLLGSIGAAPATPAYRLTFDQLYLYAGIPLGVLALGLFAVPEMFDLATKNTAISRQLKLAGRLRDGIADVYRNKFLVVRSSLLGAIVGVIPGLGGPVVDWLAYGFAKATCRGADKTFGAGDVRGVIAPESANNSKEGGALVPALLFGIPGSAPTAILLGAFLTFGITVGPAMVEENLDLTLAIIWTLVLANVAATTVCMLLARKVARLSLVPGTILFPFLLVTTVIAAYQASQNWGDIITLLVLGFVGWCMKTAGWPRSPVLIGFVLSLITERYLHVTMSRYGFDWLLFPSVIVLAVVIVVLTILGSRMGGVEGSEAAVVDETDTRHGDRST